MFKLLTEPYETVVQRQAADASGGSVRVARMELAIDLSVRNVVVGTAPQGRNRTRHLWTLPK